MMKRFLIPILMIALMLSAFLAGCGSEKKDDADQKNETKNTEATAVTEYEEDELPLVSPDVDDKTAASDGKNAGGSSNKDSGGSQSADNGGSSNRSSGDNSGGSSGNDSSNNSGNSSKNGSGNSAGNDSSKGSGKSTSPTTTGKDQDDPTIPSELSQYIEENGDDELPFVPA